MTVNVSMDLTVEQAFHILLQTLDVKLDDEPPIFEVEDGEIVCDQDDRGELYLALYHLATKIFPNTDFRHLFDNPNTLMKDLYLAKKGEEVYKDCISRQEAIDKMQELEDEDIKAYGCSIPEGFNGQRAIRALKSL